MSSVLDKILASKFESKCSFLAAIIDKSELSYPNSLIRGSFSKLSILREIFRSVDEKCYMFLSRESDDNFLLKVISPKEVWEKCKIKNGPAPSRSSVFINKKEVISTNLIAWKNKYVYDVTTSSGTFFSQGLIQHNCYNYSTYDIALSGLSMVKKIISKAPKYLTAFMAQIEQFVTIASNSTLGATGLADLFIVMGWYVQNMLKAYKSYEEALRLLLELDLSPDEKQERLEKLAKAHPAEAGFGFRTEEDIWRYVKEKLVSTIYTINQPMRGNQSPFTNVSVYDKNFLKKLCPEYKFEDGTSPDIDIVYRIQEEFLNAMNNELERTPVTFPITTACFSVDDYGNILDKSFLKLIAEKNIQFGFINIYHGKTSTLSSCCRLRSDTENLYFNLFGSGSTKIGSLGVTTINLPRLAHNFSDDEEGFLRQLIYLTKITGIVNNAKRNIVEKRIKNGNLPLYTLGFINLKSQYSTTGLTGINEVAELFGYDILEESGTNFCIKFLQVINKTIEEMHKQYESPHNVEQIPAENVAIKLVQKDKLLGLSNGYKIYSNQFIPLTSKANMLDRIRLQGLFDKYFTGGSILHLNIGQRIEDPKIIENLIESCAKQGVVYWAVNYNLQRCSEGHMSVGMTNSCAICGEEIVDNFTRVVGFLTLTKNWHKVRREVDYPNRQWYEKQHKAIGAA